MPEASLEEISLVVGLVVGGLLASFGNNDNNIISVIPNGITSTQSLWSVVTKSRKAKFTRMVRFVCNYPSVMSCYKVDCDRFGWLVK